MTEDRRSRASRQRSIASRCLTRTTRLSMCLSSSSTAASLSATCSPDCRSADCSLAMQAVGQAMRKLRSTPTGSPTPCSPPRGVRSDDRQEEARPRTAQDRNRLGRAAAAAVRRGQARSADTDGSRRHPNTVQGAWSIPAPVRQEKGRRRLVDAAPVERRLASEMEGPHRPHHRDVRGGKVMSKAEAMVYLTVGVALLLVGIVLAQRRAPAPSSADASWIVGFRDGDEIIVRTEMAQCVVASHANGGPCFTIFVSGTAVPNEYDAIAYGLTLGDAIETA